MVKEVSGSNQLFVNLGPKIEAQGTNKTDGTAGTVFHKLDKSSDRQINADEMGIEETLTDVLKYLDKLSKKVGTTAEGKAINDIKSLATALLNSAIQYDGVAQFDGINADIGARQIDAREISAIVNQLRDPKTKEGAVASFERLELMSNVAKTSLPEHNDKAKELKMQDKTSEFDKDVSAKFEQLIDKCIAEGKLPTPTDFPATNARVVINSIDVKTFAKASEYNNETRDELGRQEIKNDATRYTLTYTVNGEEYKKEIVRDVVPENDKTFFRRGDEGINIKSTSGGEDDIVD